MEVQSEISWGCSRLKLRLAGGPASQGLPHGAASQCWGLWGGCGPPPTNILTLDLLALCLPGTVGMFYQMRTKENFIPCFLFLSVDLGYENCIGKDLHTERHND